jgi:DNA-binding NtrC family response regulator
MSTMLPETIKRKTGKRILLVDDEPDITMSMGIALEAAGFEVHSFNNPIVALANFRVDYYNLVIIDIKMPNMDGFELYNQMKKIDSRIGVCFITAADKMYYEGAEQKQERGEQEEIPPKYCALSEEMFLQKPISNRDLIWEINKRIKR